jgi:hypothetical protein
MKKKIEGFIMDKVASTKAGIDLRKLPKAARPTKDDNALLASHQQHLGLYKRVARRMDVDASYVSRVAGGTRTSESVRKNLLTELGTLRTRVCKKKTVLSGKVTG